MEFSVSKIATISIFLLAACSPGSGESPTVPGRWYTAAQLDAGRVLYADNCAECHGADGSGTADWRKPGPDGRYPPPPLNGTAHTWHHALDQLDGTIANGGMRFGGVMPGFGQSLNQGQRLAIVAYIQSLWPEAIYAKWEEIDGRGR